MTSSEPVPEIEPEQVVPENAAEPRVDTDETTVLDAEPPEDETPEIRYAEPQKFKSTESADENVGAEQKAVYPDQMTLVSMETPGHEPEEVVPFLMHSGVVCVDKRAKGGAFWLIGGRELTDTVEQCKEYGVTFVVKKGGGKVTKGQEGWWAKF